MPAIDKVHCCFLYCSDLPDALHQAAPETASAGGIAALERFLVGAGGLEEILLCPISQV